VLVVSLLLMARRALAWRRVVETCTIVVPPLPDADRAFRLRLSAAPLLVGGLVAPVSRSHAPMLKRAG